MEKQKSNRYTDEQLQFVLDERNKTEKTWEEITELFNLKFKDELEKLAKVDTIRGLYAKNKDAEFTSDGVIRALKTRLSAQKRASYTAKENKIILQNIVTRDEFLDDLKETIRDINKAPLKIQKYSPKKGKTGTTLEVLISDVHFGKLTKEFNLEVCKKRLTELVRTVQQEIDYSSKIFNIDEIVVVLLGDIIESSTMHGPESLGGSEFGNSEQARQAIRCLYELVLTPLAETGHKITVVAVTGNHDRYEEQKTFNLAGKHNISWVIYNALQMLCEVKGIKNIKFYIPEETFFVYKIYGDYVLYEHGDNCKGTSRDALENHMRKRAAQLNIVISFFRLGHFHEYIVYGRGKIVINGSVVGQDSYSETLGYDSEPVQVINQYCETQHRPTTFYRSFPVFLGEGPKKLPFIK